MPYVFPYWNAGTWGFGQGTAIGRMDSYELTFGDERQTQSSARAFGSVFCFLGSVSEGSVSQGIVYGAR